MLHDFLLQRFQSGGFSTEDTLSIFLPLVREVLAVHEVGLVTPLNGLDRLTVDDGVIHLEANSQQEPAQNQAALRQFELADFGAFEVVDEQRRGTDVEDDRTQLQNARVADRNDNFERPVFVPGYTCWEHLVGHHDPLTDVYCLGMLLASIACKLDFHKLDDLRRFADHQDNLFEIHGDLHPVLAMAISRMTQLNRHRRPQDLESVLRTLEGYRDQEVDLDFDLAQIKGFNDRPRLSKRQIILAKLQEYLFEISRRNRLLQFRETAHTVNLTQASVPISSDLSRIRADQLCIWDQDFQRKLMRGRPLSLNKRLNFEEGIYLPGLLDRIRLQANRDRKEFGFAQLRMVACFLKWTNFKEEPPEQFESPLVIIPIELTKKKGIRDTFHIKCLDNEAEINPVVRHQFKALYEIDLPERIDLTETNLGEFHSLLSQVIRASEPAVNLLKIERPRIDLLHKQARRRLSKYCRRRGIPLPTASPQNSHPGGEVARRFDEYLNPNIRHVIEQQETTAQKHVKDDNPYNWEFDLCNVTLGNFKYRKMSLVRDYNSLLDDDQDNPAFDSTFSLTPGVVDNEELAELPVTERFHVVPCDPTQTDAIAKSRSGQSYIIQGPPGTGKSQTIANLIADYIIQQKRVLFVCEKRAALDVVYARLKQQGLHELCCLIHDSQTDKKLFIADLKETYEGFLKESKRRRDHKRKKRDSLLESIQNELEPLEVFNAAMSVPDEGHQVNLRGALGRLIELRDQVPELSPLEAERLPHYDDWVSAQSAIERLNSVLSDLSDDAILANHPLNRLGHRLADVDRPLEYTSQHLDDGVRELTQLLGQLDQWKPLREFAQSISDVQALVEYANDTEFLARRGLMSLLDSDGPLSRELSDCMRRLEKLDKDVEKAQSKTKNWTEKLNAEETEIALDLAKRYQGGVLRFVSPSWWKLRSTLNRCYDFDRHSVVPSWKHILTQLNKEHASILARSEAEADVTFRLLSKDVEYVDFWGDDSSLTDFTNRYVNVLDSIPERPQVVRRFHTALLTNVEADDIVTAVLDARPLISRLTLSLDAILADHQELTFEQLSSELQKIENALDQLPEYLNCLVQLSKMSPALATAFRTIARSSIELEAAIAAQTLTTCYQKSRAVQRYNATIRDAHLERLDQNLRDFLDLNAEAIRESIRQQFNDHIEMAALPKSQLSPTQWSFKKEYNRGCRELEHEFGKTMRYKSIRDLVAGESGMVVRDLKPVWLMSPLSVSDTLPLDTEHVDVVIFDEASQITLEEAVPSLFRAKQCIVVGDEMQLPPTNFFSAKKDESDNEAIEFEEAEGEIVQYDLDCNSFLSHAARNLSRRMLGWHYRSRSESLISFSNWAFYQGQLLTIPDEQLPSPDRRELEVTKTSDAEAYTTDLLERPVSFHFLRNGRYEKRRNEDEGKYIAELVRQLLLRETGLTIGVVAFSEAQQGEIESAIERLAGRDSDFAQRFEEEIDREEDGQFMGLLIKNLENIQGDERDIIILSICYGHPPTGKMRMSFGPINKSGGEKRLNVAFSRAKQHMVVISSINSNDITNDYNDGARCLKGYLQYTRAASIGNSEVVGNVLRELTIHRSHEAESQEADIVATQLAEALKARGLEVDFHVGQSLFRCDLGVRHANQSHYVVGILVDSLSSYEQTDLIERELMKPNLLRAFGWNVVQVLAKDWYHAPQQVLDEVIAVTEVD